MRVLKKSLFSQKLLERLSNLSRYAAPVRMLALIFVLLLIWLPIALPLYFLIPDANTRTIVTMSVLFVEFLVLLKFWGRAVYQDNRIWQSYGLVFSRQSGRELLQGVGIALIGLVVLFSVQSGLGWVMWRSPSLSLGRVILEGLLSALGIAFAEELFFRGWILEELQRDYNPRTALIANSLIFATLHFLKPLPEILRTLPGFPALTILGLALVWAKRSTRQKIRRTNFVSIHSGRLGLPIGLHAGLVWGVYILYVGQLVQFSDRIPPWLTGIDNNPLMSLTGILGLSAIATYMANRAKTV